MVDKYCTLPLFDINKTYNKLEFFFSNNVMQKLQLSVLYIHT